ncbi:MAG TPA: F0F1 ATP synthase subunit gamma [Desulfatiglandales bacterium]|nr:F0F1 ATP synthase subunit gamma [Desulfatiglandales bacterium]
MQTIEGLKKKIQSTEDLLSVVKTMKALAAVSIRQYERAVESLNDYNRAVEMGLQVVLRDRPHFMIGAQPAPHDRLGTVIFGTDQGMAGALNEQVLSYTMAALDDLNVKPEDRTVMAVGERMMGLLEDTGQPVEAFSPVPSSVAGIIPRVQETLLRIEGWNRELGLNQIYLFYSTEVSGTASQPHMVHLLPLDQEWLLNLKTQSWPSRALPYFTMDWDALFSSLIHEYLFISLFRAFAESLASENASRLASMQGAERNIEEMLTELHANFQQRRQMTITEELLDIVAGFEALKENQ